MPTESQKLQILIKDRAPSTKRKYLGQLDTIQRALGGDVELATLDQILYFLNRTPNPHTRATATRATAVSSLSPSIVDPSRSARARLRSPRCHAARPPAGKPRSAACSVCLTSSSSSWKPPVYFLPCLEKTFSA